MTSTYLYERKSTFLEKEFSYIFFCNFYFDVKIMFEVGKNLSSLSSHGVDSINQLPFQSMKTKL